MEELLATAEEYYHNLLDAKTTKEREKWGYKIIELCDEYPNITRQGYWKIETLNHFWVDRFKKLRNYEPPKKLPNANNKHYLYVGHYFDDYGRYILKIGTTNNLSRRKIEHTRNYGSGFEYDWFLPLSKYNTLRYEDKNRSSWIELGFGEFIRNDRFLCSSKPKTVKIKIRKEYIIEL